MGDSSLSYLESFHILFKFFHLMSLLLQSIEEEVRHMFHKNLLFIDGTSTGTSNLHFDSECATELLHLLLYMILGHKIL